MELEEGNWEMETEMELGRKVEAECICQSWSRHVGGQCRGSDHPPQVCQMCLPITSSF